MPRPSDRNTNSVQRSTAAQLKEHEPLFSTYEHLSGQPRSDAALTMLRKVASMVKPIMRKHNWRVQVLAEFLPREQNLLGLNVNKGYKICLRLRYHNHSDLFLPIEEVVDTMLHELSHNVWGAHDSNFHKLWDELRDEYEVLLRKGYTGEGFLSAGQRLGGGQGPARLPQSPSELRRLARASAEKRQVQGTLSFGSGQRLGGTPLHRDGRDIRQVIADQAIRRNVIDRGCASGRQDADKLVETQTFATQAEEDDANDRAIAQALYELMEQEEMEKLKPNTRPLPSEEEQMRWAMGASTPSAPSPPATSNDPPKPPKRRLSMEKPVIELTSTTASPPRATQATLKDKDEWTCPICTCINPMQYLSCDACASERPSQPQPRSTSASSSSRPTKKRDTEISNTKLTIARNTRRDQILQDAKIKEEQVRAGPLGWTCHRCLAFMEQQWWTCSACGAMKETS